jgi:outer membrane protein insertion porin family
MQSFRMILIGLLLGCFAVTSLSAQDDQLDLKVRRVDFRGNKTYPDLVLRTVIANRERSLMERFQFWKRTGYDYVETDVRRDVIRIQRYYQRRGFSHVRVTYQIRDGKHDWQRDIRFSVDEGTPTLVRTFEVEWPEGFDSESVQSSRGYRRALNRNPLKVDERFEPIQVADTEGLFKSTLQNLGYAFALVTLEQKTDTNAIMADLTLKLDPGPVTFIDTIHVEGHESVKASLIRRETGIEKGDQFNQRYLGRAQQEIFSHHLFRFVTVSVPDQERDSTVNLFIRVREFPLRSVRTLVGFGNEEYFRGNASWTHRNPFGNAHSFTTSIRASFLEQRINVDYLIPYVYNTSSSYVVSPFAQRVDEESYLLLRYGATNTFLYRYSQNTVGSVSYELTRNEEFLKSVQVELRDSTLLYDKSALQFSGYYQQFLFDPSDGWAIRPFVEFSGLFGLGTITYQKASLDLRRYIPLKSGTQLALRVESGALLAPSLDLIPANIRFYAGGTNSVRGYGRWQLGPKRATTNGLVPDGGRAMLSFNTELRQNAGNLLNGLSTNLFFDGGQVWRRFDEYGYTSLQYSVGVGVGYASFLGPIRLDVGYKLNPKQQDLDTELLGRWGIHFSVGQAF